MTVPSSHSSSPPVFAQSETHRYQFLCNRKEGLFEIDFETTLIKNEQYVENTRLCNQLFQKIKECFAFKEPWWPTLSCKRCNLVYKTRGLLIELHNRGVFFTSSTPGLAFNEKVPSLSGRAFLWLNDTSCHPFPGERGCEHWNSPL